jgi:RNA polymerase sigma factor (TIGR02999 family)
MCAAPGKDDVPTVIQAERRETLNQLVPMVYAELRAAAHRQLNARRRAEEGSPTLGTTALVNEVYLKLVDQSHLSWHDHAHFLSVAAVAMRHILVDRARARASVKRGGERRRVTLDEDAIALDDQADVLLAIDEALGVLESLHPRLAQVVVSRFYGGLSEEETAEALGVTVRTVQRDWTKARLLLRRALKA